MTDVTIEDWAEGNWVEAIFNMYTGVGGEMLVGAIIGATILIAMWIHSDDLALPTVILILFAPSLWAVLPGDLQSTAYGVMLVGGVAALMTVLERYVL